ncbi:MAG: 6-carboxytetrahydropterin synthase [Calditrichaceae bacterium]
MTPEVSLSRSYIFSAAHRLHSSVLSESENIDVYDKCNNFNGHGHDYTLEVTVAGKPNPNTGMIIPLPLLDDSVNSLLKQMDHRHLDMEVGYFNTHISTGEIIIQYLWKELERRIPDGKLYHLKLWETNNNYFEIGKENI